MIRFVIAAALAAATAAECGTENDPPKTAPPPFDWASLDASSTAPAVASGTSPGVDPTDARVIGLKKLDAALAATDPKAYAELFAVDAVVSVPGVSEWKGREDIAAMHAKIFHAFDDTKVGSSRVWLRKDRAAVEWTLTGTHARTWLGVSATSKPIAIQALSVYGFDGDGRVKSARIYLDVVTVLGQVGAALKGFEAGPTPTLPTTTEVIVAQGTPEEDTNVAINDATGTALEQGNIDAIVNGFADDVMHYSIGGAPIKGRDAERKAYEGIKKTMSNLKVKIDGWGVRSFVIEEVTANAVSVGGATPKKPIVWRGASVIELKDKKVVRQWTFTNRADMLSQLGVKFTR